MSEPHDPFFPQHVDESIEHLASSNQANDIFHGQRAEVDRDTHLIHDLQQIYSVERKRYQQALQRVENRLMEQSLAQEKKDVILPITSLSQQPSFKRKSMQQRRGNRMKTKRPSFASVLTSVGGRISLVAVALILIGSIVVVLNYVHQTTLAGQAQVTAPLPTATPIAPTPTPAPPGETLYTTPANTVGFNGLSWSPDSKRIASSSIQGVQIWDAIDGQHKVSVQIASPSEWAYGLDWSPNSQQLAIATNQAMFIVDGQSGRVLQTHAAPSTAMIHPVSSGTSYLASQFPASGGQGYRATAWSPDGQLIASAPSFGPSGEVQVWNPETNAIDFTIQANGPYNVGALSWSSDSQYIAAYEENTQSINMSQPNTTIVVWQVSTRQIVFQHNILGGNGAEIVWQPHSHNLAFSNVTLSGGNLSGTEALELWDVIAGKQVKQYPGADNSYGLAWSPDGKYLAYGGYDRQNTTYEVMIIDASTGKQVYTYKGHHKNVSVIAWSPNGKYIVSGEGNTDGNMVAKVWFVGSLAQN
ncbi:MAG TPA: hypothetical protein VL485_22975 [Ktedonobacteraceae bacterium]|nr:hypothetical protein [Ktedonobacteraceae bacterium]